MKIFLDTASLSEIKEGVALGVVDGVTTNPSLIAKEKRPFRPLVEEICSIVPGEVSLEVVATDFEGMVKEGEELAQVAPNAVVKCPLTKDGLKAVKYLSGKGIRVNQTLCFSATQALLSAKAGAVYNDLAVAGDATVGVVRGDEDVIRSAQDRFHHRRPLEDVVQPLRLEVDRPDDAQLRRDLGERRAIPDRQALQERRNVLLHRLLGQPDAVRDLLV